MCNHDELVFAPGYDIDTRVAHRPLDQRDVNAKFEQEPQNRACVCVRGANSHVRMPSANATESMPVNVVRCDSTQRNAAAAESLNGGGGGGGELGAERQASTENAASSESRIVVRVRMVPLEAFV